MGFFWPAKLNHDANALVRFGRVLHWIGTGLFALIGSGAIFSFGLAIYQAATFEYYWPNTAVTGVGVLVFGLLCYFAGRALRYIFSGE